MRVKTLPHYNLGQRFTLSEKIVTTLEKEQHVPSDVCKYIQYKLSYRSELSSKLYGHEGRRGQDRMADNYVYCCQLGIKNIEQEKKSM